jgi:uncharacterized membrane protein
MNAILLLLAAFVLVVVSVGGYHAARQRNWVGLFSLFAAAIGVVALFAGFFQRTRIIGRLLRPIAAVLGILALALRLSRPGRR